MDRFEFTHRTCSNCGHLDPSRTQERTVEIETGREIHLIEHGCDAQKSGSSLSFEPDGKCEECCGAWSCPMKYRSQNAGESRKLGAEIWKSHERWLKIIKDGAGDPFWPDGTNANLVRNHILYFRGECEALLLPKDYPPEYAEVPVPPEVSNGYMAGKDKPPIDPEPEKKKPLPLGQLSLFDFGLE